MWGGGGMWVRSDVMSGRNRHWEWRPDTEDAEDRKTTSDASGRAARASDVGLIFADVSEEIVFCKRIPSDKQASPVLSAEIVFP